MHDATRIPAAMSLACLALVAGSGTCAIGVGLAADPAQELAFTSLGLELFIAIAACAGAALSRQPLRERLGLGPGRLSWPLVLSLAVGTLALSHSLDALMELLELREHSALQDFAERLEGVRGITLVLALLTIALAPGFAEELLCRGLVQRGLQARWGPGLGIPLAALFFGAIHLEPIHASFATGLGLYLGLAAYLDGSIRAAVVCHVANNAAAVTLAALAGSSDPVEPLMLPLGLTVAGVCLVWVMWRAGRPPDLEAIPRERAPGDYSGDPDRTNRWDGPSEGLPCSEGPRSAHDDESPGSPAG